MTEWIKCTEKMPPDGVTVLIYYRMHKKEEENYHWHMATAFLDESNYLYDIWLGWVEDPDGLTCERINIPLRFVTHWSYLPQSPENIK